MQAFFLPGKSPRARRLTDLACSSRIKDVPSFVGLWRSWERASMAWKRSSVRSRSGPPIKPFVHSQPILMHDAHHGALPTLYAATDPAAAPGGYYGFQELKGLPKEAKI